MGAAGREIRYEGRAGDDWGHIRIRYRKENSVELLLKKFQEGKESRKRKAHETP